MPNPTPFRPAVLAIDSFDPTKRLRPSSFALTDEADEHANCRPLRP